VSGGSLPSGCTFLGVPLLDAADLFDQPLRTMSLGQRMRCELAACLLHGLLVRLNEEDGTTVFLTSHDVADIEQVARRAIVINHGIIIHDGDVAGMRRGLLRTRILNAALSRPIEAPILNGVTTREHTPSSITLEGRHGCRNDPVRARRLADRRFRQ
jgi:ABC-type uncharacterized transport system ATPase subunit